MSRRKKIVIVVAGCAVVAAGVSYALIGGSGGSSSASTVIYSPVSVRDLKATTVLTGTLGHKNVTTVAAQSPGFVSAVYATDNATAKAGDPLFALGGRTATAEMGTLPFFRSLAPGDVGDDVLQLKHILAAAGDNPGAMDNVFTQSTQAALAAWQAQNHYPSATPASQEAVTVGLQQGTGYNVGARSTAGLVIGPPPGQTSMGPTPPPTTSSGSPATSPAPSPSSGSSAHAAGAAREVRAARPAARSGRTSRHRSLAAIGTPERPHATVPSLSIAGGGGVSPGNTVTLTVRASVAPAADVDVYLTVSGDAVAGVDYTPVNPVVVLSAAATTATLTIATLSNQTIEPNRFLDVAISPSPSGSYTVGEPGTASITIDEPSGPAAIPTATLTSATTYLTKGSPFSVQIGLSQAVSTSVTIQLDYTGTAQEGPDYTRLPGLVVIPAGQTSVQVPIPTASNNLVEPDRVLTVSLAPSSAYTIGSPSSASVTIHDPNVPQMHITGSTTIALGGPATLTVVASQAPVYDTQVALSFSGSAQAGTDYSPPDPVVTIKAGTTSATVTLVTLVSQNIEPDRYIVVSVAQSASGSYTVDSPGSAVITLAGATATSAPPILTLSSPIQYLHKGEPFQVEVFLSQAVATPVTVHLGFSGTAARGIDYTIPGTIQIPPGQTSIQVTIPTISSNTVQSDRVLTVGLVPSLEYQIGIPNVATVTITSLVVPTLTISASTADLSEGGDATFTITADQAPVKDTSVNFTVQGTAQPGQDYVPLAGTVLLRAGQTQVTVTFQSISKDVVFEPTDMIVGQWPIRIGQVYVKQGNTVTTGNPLLDLTVPSVSVTLQASPSDFTKLAVGQGCTMTIAGGQKEFTGVVSELDSNPTLQSGSSSGQSSQQVFEGQVEVSDLGAGDANADGASVSITVTTQEVSNALSVPIAAVKQNGTGTDVVRIIDFQHRGRISEVTVTTGLTEGSYVQVTGGLHLGETVVVTVDQKQS